MKGVAEKEVDSVGGPGGPVIEGESVRVEARRAQGAARRGCIARAVRVLTRTHLGR